MSDDMATVLGPIGELRAHALQYAQLGLEVFPVSPSDKTPLVSQYEATVNVEQVEAWWSRWPSALIGHRLPEHVIVLDIDPRHNGHSTWAALHTALGHDWPKTRAHASGRGDGGGHTWWLRPDDKLSTVALDAWARTQGTGHAVPDSDRWVSGIDLLQRQHRYTILPPSPHPATGKPYSWLDGRGLDHAVAAMPAMLADLLVVEARVVAPAAPRSTSSDSIIDVYRSSHSLAALLHAEGWTLRAGNGDDDGSRWRHPQATSAVSATVSGGRLYVYSPNTPFEPTSPGDPRGFDVFDVFTTLRHRGNASEAARAARDEHGGGAARIDVHALVSSQDPPGSPLSGSGVLLDESLDPVDLGAVLDGSTVQPVPSLLLRDDGRALFYDGSVNGLHGDSGAGKGWVVCYVIAENARRGRRTMLLDLEDTASSITARLRLLGMADTAIVTWLVYVRPQVPFGVAAVDHLCQLVGDLAVQAVVIDSLGEAFALSGIDENHDAEVGPWLRSVARPLADTGAAVVLIDHSTKASDNPLHPSGSKRKRAAITGASYLAESVVPFVKGRGGRLRLTCAKDRHGNFRRAEAVGDLVMESSAQRFGLKLYAPSIVGAGDVEVPTMLAARAAVAALKKLGRSASRNELEGLMDVKARAEIKRGGIDFAIAEGALAQRKMGRALECSFVHDMDAER